MVANVPWDGAILNPRGIIGRICVKHQLTLLHTKYTSALGLAVSEKIFFSHDSYYKPMADNYVPVTWPVWTPRTWLSSFIKTITEYCYAQNMKALGLMVSEKRGFVNTGKKQCVFYSIVSIEPLGLVVSGKIFYGFPILSLWQIMTPPGCDLYGTQGHG